MVKEMEKLALLGGDPVIKNPVSFQWPRITKEIELAVVDQLKTEISIQNRSGIIAQFEKQFTQYHKRRHGLLVNSGTMALYSAFYALDLEESDEVIVPVYTFFATVTPLLFTKAKIRMADCDRNGNIDPLKIIEQINSKTRAVVVTHMWGYPADYLTIRKICNKYNICMIEDCSHAHGASFGKWRIGELGDIAIFSMQGQKIITGGEGGIILTDNNDYYYKMVLLGHYNKRSLQEIPHSNMLYKYCQTGFGLKLRSHPLAVRIMMEMFKELPTINKEKMDSYSILLDGLCDLDCIEVQKCKNDVKHSGYAFIIKYMGEERYGVSKEKFVNALIAEGCIDVDIPKSTQPLYNYPLFSESSQVIKQDNSLNKFNGDSFPSSDFFYRTIIKVPGWLKNDREIILSYIYAFRKVQKNILYLK